MLHPLSMLFAFSCVFFLSFFLRLQPGFICAEALGSGEQARLSRWVSPGGRAGAQGTQAQPSKRSFVSQVQGATTLPLRWRPLPAASRYVLTSPSLLFSDSPE